MEKALGNLRGYAALNTAVRVYKVGSHERALRATANTSVLENGQH